MEHEKPIRAIVPIAITAIITAAIVGGGVFAWQKSVQRDMVERAREEAREDARGESAELISRLEYRIKNLENLRTIYSDGERHFFEVYDLDLEKNRWLETIALRVPIQDSLPVIDKLRTLADEVSVFIGKHRTGIAPPINVLRIEEHAGRRIAVIRLEKSGGEDPRYDDCLWVHTFGSGGGAAITTTLVETFLQKGYKGEWVDGIQFYDRDEPLIDSDHIGLGGIIYRDGTRECEYE